MAPSSISLRQVWKPPPSTVSGAQATRNFRFLLTWHFPNRTPERCGWDAPAGKSKTLIGNHYCTRFSDAWAVAQHVAANLPELEKRTRDFVSAFGSNIADISHTLFTTLLLPFEVTSILILVAILGAVVLARKEL